MKPRLITFAETSIFLARFIVNRWPTQPSGIVPVRQLPTHDSIPVIWLPDFFRPPMLLLLAGFRRSHLIFDAVRFSCMQVYLVA
jgi:hypothetical protein